MIRTDPILDRYRRNQKRSRFFADAIYTPKDSAPIPLRAQKQFGETVKFIGGQEMVVTGVRAIIDAADIPGDPTTGDTVLFVDHAELYRVREFRTIGDGFLECQLDL